MADVSVRLARAEDAERVAVVQLSTWRTAYSTFLPEDTLVVPLAEAASLWLRAIELPPSARHRVLVALEGAELVGFAACEPSEDADVEAVEVTAMLVEPRWGRRGHGSRLLAAAVESWREDGAGLAVAWVWERDAASRSFLTAAGWQPDGAARGLDTGPRIERQLRMHADVRP